MPELNKSCPTSSPSDPLAARVAVMFRPTASRWGLPRHTACRMQGLFPDTLTLLVRRYLGWRHQAWECSNSVFERAGQAAQQPGHLPVAWWAPWSGRHALPVTLVSACDGEALIHWR